MEKYYFITFLDKLGEDDIGLMFQEITEDIFFISNQQAILKSNKEILDIKDEAKITKPNATGYIILEITKLNNLEIYSEENPEFDRFINEITSEEPSQEEIDYVLEKLFKYGKNKLTAWDYKILDYRSQVVD